MTSNSALQKILSTVLKERRKNVSNIKVQERIPFRSKTHEHRITGK